MTKRYQRSRAQDLEAFQHGKDDYWFRPVVFGKNLHTYIAYVPPGGFMAPHGHEEDPYELYARHDPGDIGYHAGW